MVGLGNQGEEYTNTRHNVGRDTLRALEKKLKQKSLPAGRQGKVVLLDSYMNNSGRALKPLVKSHKVVQKLVVLHDDLDLPLGSVKLSFGSGPGGHKGVESVQTALKTRDFVRIRIGISPATASGKIKKPDHKGVVDFVLGKFKPSEQEKLKKARRRVADALELLLNDGLPAAMTEINSH